MRRDLVLGDKIPAIDMSGISAHSKKWLTYLFVPPCFLLFFSSRFLLSFLLLIADDVDVSPAIYPETRRLRQSNGVVVVVVVVFVVVVVVVVFIVVVFIVVVVAVVVVVVVVVVVIVVVIVVVFVVTGNVSGNDDSD